MARSLRYEASGAVCHVMARGDGGREVFEEDKDRFDWLDRSGEVCGTECWTQWRMSFEQNAGRVREDPKIGRKAKRLDKAVD